MKYLAFAIGSLLGVGLFLWKLETWRELEATIPPGVDRTAPVGHVVDPESPTAALLDSAIARVDRRAPSDVIDEGDRALEQARDLAAENERMREQIEQLEATLSDSQREDRNRAVLELLMPAQDRSADSPFGRWAATLRDDEIPSEPDLNMLAGYLAEWPVEVSTAEGLWIAERSKADDWLTYGPTADEAVLTFLGPKRVLAAVEKASPERAAMLRELYAAEGYFE
jgi:hypothetical protein